MSHKPWAGGKAAPELVQSTLGCMPFMLGLSKVLSSSFRLAPSLGIAGEGRSVSIPLRPRAVLMVKSRF